MTIYRWSPTSVSSGTRGQMNDAWLHIQWERYWLFAFHPSLSFVSRLNPFQRDQSHLFYIRFNHYIVIYPFQCVTTLSNAQTTSDKRFELTCLTPLVDIHTQLSMVSFKWRAHNFTSCNWRNFSNFIVAFIFFRCVWIVIHLSFEIRVYSLN